MLAIDKQGSAYLYRQVIDLIGENIDVGTLRPGDRLPSLRRMSKRIGPHQNSRNRHNPYQWRVAA